MHPPDAAIRAARLSPRPQAAQHLLKWSSLPSSRLLCLPLSGAASLQVVPERPLPPRLQQEPSPPSQLCTRSSGCGSASRLLRQCLSACSVRQEAPLHACDLSSGPSDPSATRSTAWTLRQFNCHCHFSSPNSLAVSHWKTSSLQPYVAVFLIDYGNLPGPTEGRQLNRPTA